VLSNSGRCYRSSVSFNAVLQRFLWVHTGLGEDTRFAGMGKLCASATAITSVCLPTPGHATFGVDVILAGACADRLLPGRHRIDVQRLDQTECLDPSRFLSLCILLPSAKTTGWEENRLGVRLCHQCHGREVGESFSHWPRRR